VTARSWWKLGSDALRSRAAALGVAGLLLGLLVGTGVSSYSTAPDGASSLQDEAAQQVRVSADATATAPGVLLGQWSRDVGRLDGSVVSSSLHSDGTHTYGTAQMLVPARNLDRLLVQLGGQAQLRSLSLSPAPWHGSEPQDLPGRLRRLSALESQMREELASAAVSESVADLTRRAVELEAVQLERDRLRGERVVIAAAQELAQVTLALLEPAPPMERSRGLWLLAAVAATLVATLSVRARRRVSRGALPQGRPSEVSDAAASNAGGVGL
jgi:hypothetical protein